ncbi:hypothetical protein H3N56_06735 [Cetobacterium sp. 2A]|uniref:hypothetical protein n=1 Tax=Cetobacterium sp. 2A TaxID=2754723 RepID=UPI00163C84E5|nr:hypothetical protein [Cetobacterium sp. 2A]MBC2856168.1 hypothetical protein [Cetobacterium sp. 2A]
MEIKNYEDRGSQNYKRNEVNLYETIEILVKQKLIVATVIGLSIFTSSFLAFKETKNIKNKNIVKFTEISKQKLTLGKVEAKLIEVENKIQNIIADESKAFTNAIGISELITLKYSTILREKKELEEKYEKEKKKLEAMKKPVRDNKKLILTAGIFLGIFLGIFTAFFKEFIEIYKKRK